MDNQDMRKFLHISKDTITLTKRFSLSDKEKEINLTTKFENETKQVENKELQKKKENSLNFNIENLSCLDSVFIPKKEKVAYSLLLTAMVSMNGNIVIECSSSKE